jgi:hypothetical protein
MSEPVEVDFDLLADYVGGALDGTPEQDRVAALVATDPGWAREHELLIAALAATADDLATFAEQTAEPMPDEVLSRLLGSLPETAATSSAGARGGPGRDNRAPVRRRPEAGQRPTGRARHRPRWRSWAAPALVAASVAAFAGVWINQSVGTGTTATDTAAAGPQVQEHNSAGGDALTLPRYATGRDYTDAAVAGGFTDGGVAAKPTESASVMSEQTNRSTRASMVDPELLRLNGDAALAVCVGAIEQELGRGPITVSAADFASYQGRPAVLIFFTDSSGARWGWAVGPDCGPGGTDDLIRARVG